MTDEVHPTRILTCFVCDQQSCVHGFHAGWASKAPHQPIIDAVGVVCMHTWQVPDPISNHKLNHANDTPIKENDLKDITREAK